MKKFILALLLISYIFTGICTAKNDAVCNKYIRLHILANSNSGFDQTVKISVKNTLLKEFANEFESFVSKEDTIKYVKDNREKIEDYIDKYLKENNIDYTSRISITEELYKKGMFNNVNLPEGKYTAVKILLGKGKGKNLFFIMFPFLSLKEDVTVKSNGEGKIEYKSKIVETIKNFRQQR